MRMHSFILRKPTSRTWSARERSINTSSQTVWRCSNRQTFAFCFVSSVHGLAGGGTRTLMIRHSSKDESWYNISLHKYVTLTERTHIEPRRTWCKINYTSQDKEIDLQTNLNLYGCIFLFVILPQVAQKHATHTLSRIWRETNCKEQTKREVINET